ncbi:hypothetical protein RJZ56_004311 [Blastomyces dermatitidis]|uniref:Uncharacterized protein n=1 Tax=Ajellomyces dermatitidis (strain ER-3 / ATCC MYA-2586) TaxID=559297 RepID=A0ABP2EUU0_AJEDR|nr:uncharacterized protein BDCG_02748 [Blastomyces dermatitidis ER-3]EEQ87628.1 hypothetical protein BDCG_02748 [Blastomyces dermatitidis ER-3]EQL38067.1 hypothetical protein BDFG_00458 [Blastomyces dermatitidis ATCC 26199]
MALQHDTLEKILQFAETNHKLEEERDRHPIDHRAYNQKLDQTLSQLQAQVRRQEDALQQLRRSTIHGLPRPGLEPRMRLAQIRRATKAYKSLSQTVPDLPHPDSPLPTLLALRESSRQILDLKSSIDATAHDLSASRERLKAEQAAARDAQLISTGLDDRIKTLQSARPEEREKRPAQLAKEFMQQQRRRKVELEKKTAALKEALRVFIDDHLAAMLAAENLGGPVVGDQLEVSDATLAAGYTTQGKERRIKAPAGAEVERDSRQQRIDELVSRLPSGSGGGDGYGHRGGIGSKREAAGQEVHALIDSLVEAASTSSYIKLERDTAASRFLVKAKIAQFHPRDARRLRLIDFARELID